MALKDLTGQQIQNTYQKVVQTDGTNLADGTGSLLPISFNGNNVIVSGSLIAQTYVVSESVINVSSGSTIFGNSEDDSHFFSGSLTASGNISASGDITLDRFLEFGSTIPSVKYNGGDTLFAANATQLAFGNVHVRIGDNQELRFGVDGDWKIKHVNTNTPPTLQFQEGSTTRLELGIGGHITASGDISASGDLYAAHTTLSPRGIDANGSGEGMVIGSSFQIGVGLQIDGNISASGDIIAKNITLNGDITAENAFFDANTLFLGGTSFSKNELDTLKEGRTINTTTKDLGEGDTNKNNIVRPNAIMSPVDDSTYQKFTLAGRVGQFVGGHLYFDQNAVNDSISLGKANDTQLTLKGNITASGNISASNAIYAYQYYAASGYRIEDSSGTSRHIITEKDNYLSIGNSNLNGIEITGSAEFNSNITASGNISASGNVLVDHVIAHRVYIGPHTAAARLTFDDTSVVNNMGLHNQGHITASGNISSSSTISSLDMRVGTLGVPNGIFRFGAPGDKNFPQFRQIEGNQLLLDRGNNENLVKYNFNQHSDGPKVSVIGDISASGNIYSKNEEIFQSTFLTDSDTVNWHGPNRQGPTYYFWNYDYGTDAQVGTIDWSSAAHNERTLNSGWRVPYKMEITRFHVYGHNNQNASDTDETLTFTASIFMGNPETEAKGQSSMRLHPLGTFISTTGESRYSAMSGSANISSTSRFVSESQWIYPRIKCNNDDQDINGTWTVYYRRVE